jgi:hypothetical protein
MLYEPHEREITATRRKLIMREVSQMGAGAALSLDTLNALALRHHVPENRVRGLLVACGYRIPEPLVRQRTDQDPIKKPAPPPAAAKPPVPPEVIAGILKGAIYRQLGEEDDAYVVTTRAAFLREREAIRLILKSCPPPDRVSTLWCVKGGFANHNAVCG